MARSDYAHWNEDADYMWWQEEGRHSQEDQENDYDPDDWRMGAEEAQAEEEYEQGEYQAQTDYEDHGERRLPADTTGIHPAYLQGYEDGFRTMEVNEQ